MEEDVMIVTRANQRPVLRSRDPVLTNQRPVFDMCDQCPLCRVWGDWATSSHHCHCTLGKKRLQLKLWGLLQNTPHSYDIS